MAKQDTAAQSQAETKQISQVVTSKVAAEQEVLKAMESEKSAALNQTAAAETRAHEAYTAHQQAMRKAAASKQAAHTSQTQEARVKKQETTVAPRQACS